MDLKKLIEENWDNNSFMSLAANKTIRDAIIEQTRFLDEHYKNIQLRSGAYCIKKGIKKIFDCGYLRFRL